MILYVAYVEALNGNRLYCHDTSENAIRDWLWRTINVLTESGHPVQVYLERRDI